MSGFIDLSATESWRCSLVHSETFEISRLPPVLRLCLDLSISSDAYLFKILLEPVLTPSLRLVGRMTMFSVELGSEMGV